MVFPLREFRSAMVGLTGLEPVTSSLSGKRSNRLSYRPAAAYRAGRARPTEPEHYPTPEDPDKTRSAAREAAQSSSARVTSMPPSRAAAML